MLDQRCRRWLSSKPSLAQCFLGILFSLVICQSFDVNPSAPEVLVSIFHSFEAGIANAISSFKWRKIFLFMKNNHLQYWIIRNNLTLSILSLPLSSSSTTSRELLSQFSTCSGWRWFDVGVELKKITMYLRNYFIEIYLLKPLAVKK